MSRSIDSYLNTAAGAAALINHAKLIYRLQQIFKEILPDHLTQGSQVVNYKGGIVIIHAGSGAVAAKLKQLTTTLAAGFSRAGVDCSEVKVKVQPPEISRVVKPLPQRTMPASGNRAIRGLADSLAPSPLKEALEQLLSRTVTKE